MSDDVDYRDATRLEHMLQALERISRESESLTRDNLYFEDRLTRAILFDFVVLGEAANNISAVCCSRHPEISWKEVSGIRHKIVHDYAGINYDILWDAITKDVPNLLPVLRSIVASLPSTPPISDKLGEFLA